jgi:predicted N-formylglutamate amidohydrolase
MNEHGMKRGIPNVAIEIRQDLIDTHQGAEKWASIMADALTRLGPLAPYEPGGTG